MASILIIDDDPEILTLLKTALSCDFHQVQTARNGREGLKFINESRYDLVITDIIMPEFDGFELIMAIKEMQQKLRIIAITGGSTGISQDFIKTVTKAMGVHRVLLKPFSITELTLKVREVLDSN
jgi:YesN/AraC family two-component response regulator